MLKNPTNMLIILALSLLIILVSCQSKSEEEAIEEAKDTAEMIFTTSQTMTPNKELEHLSLYLPEHLEIEEIDENNILLSNAKQTYIIFYNDLEEPTSELNYQIAQNNETLLLEAFSDKEKFGYIQILPESDGQYEIQVGIGGIKITTYTTKKEMAKHAEELMEVALSIESLDNQYD